MIAYKLATLDDILATPAHERSPNHTNRLGEEVVVLLEGARVVPLDLQLRICREETRGLKGA